MLLVLLSLALWLADAAKDVPAWEVATWLSNDSFSDEPFAGYCAHPPAQARTVSVAPTPDEEEALAGSDLVGLQVAFRHGARVFCKMNKARDCFKVANFSMHFQCGIRRKIALMAGEKASTESKPLEIEQVLEGPGIESHCDAGDLQDEAALQFDELARSFRRHYDFDALGINLNTTKLRTDQVDRVVDSLYFLTSSLFPDARQVKAHVTGHNHAGWGNHAHCPRAIFEYHQMDHAVNKPRLPTSRTPDFPRQWQEVAGTTFKPMSFKDCLTQAACTPQPLPAGFTPDLFRWAITESWRAYQAKYYDSKNSQALAALVAPAIFELQDVLREQTSSTRASRKRLVLYGSHDIAIVCIMVAFGAWDGIWPKYAEAVILEAYRRRSSSGSRPGPQAVFRLLRGGRPVLLPGCGNRSVCDVNIFLRLGPQYFRDPETWNEWCHAGELDEEVSLETASTGLLAFGGQPATMSSNAFVWCWLLATLTLCALTAVGTARIVRHRDRLHMNHEHGFVRSPLL